MTLGERLKQLRKEAGLTQEELAKKVGLKKQNISRYENSHVEPNIRTAKRIADALGVSIEEMAVGVSLPSPSAPAPVALSPDESQLVEDYRGLTPPGQEYIRQTMAMAVRTYFAGDGALPQLEDVE